MTEETTGSTPPENSPQEFFVVGIGASAGGVAALKQFFSHVQPDSGMAFVVILHLSPQHESNLPALIQNQTSLPVTQVTNAVKVEPNHVYVIPPSKYLVIVDGMIRPEEPGTRGRPASIDLFFRTLADGYGKDAIAILLSGTGADGTLGLGRIKEEGGLAIVQDPAEAEYGEMPRSAINTALVDLILPVSEMPGKLIALRDGAKRLQIPPEKEEALPPEFDAALREMLALLRLRTGNDFSQYKAPTLLRRVARRMHVRGLGDLPAYLNFLREHPEEISALQRDLLITVTNFFRDHDSFEFLRKEIVPQLFANKGPDDQVRVWSAGCATGEEASSLAIILAEHASNLAEPPAIQVFGTDIDEKALAAARECRYPATIAVDVSPERLQHFFVKENDRYRIKKELREMVLFAPHNVLRDPPFSRLDLISCRNLLIYLNRAMQERILGNFHFGLRSGGYLFLGASESAEITPALFTPLDKKRRVYTRRPIIGPAQLAPDLMVGKWPARTPDVPGAIGANISSAGKLHQELVEQVAPPSVLVNGDYDIVHISAHAGRYLRMAGGEPTRNLLRLAHPDLSLELRAALIEAKAGPDGGAAASRKAQIQIDGQTRAVTLTVRPAAGKPEEARGFFLVIFDETTDTAPIRTYRPEDGAELEVVRQLEQELQRTKDELRLTIEQYETSVEELRASNEELQAINEELRSATEELETSREELQSVNEELTTVNQDYREKIEELGRANSNLRNLMASTDIGTIFLDRTLQIKLYTPPAAKLFNVTPADIGRPLEHFTHNLDYRALTTDAEEVLRTTRSSEREVRGNDGHWHLVRLAPYRALEEKIEGVVLTFVDITNRKLDEEQLRRQTATLREQAEILNLAHVLVLDQDRRILLWNVGCERLYGYTSEQAVGQISHELLKTEFPVPRAQIQAQLEKTGQWQGELVHTTAAGERIVVASHLILHRRQPNESAVILEVDSDISARRLAEDALREADRSRQTFLAVLAHELRNPLAAMLSSVELLRRSAAGNEAQDLARSVIDRQLQNLTRMVDDLLDLQRLTHGKIALSKRRVSLSEVIGAALETTRPATDADTHKFNVSIPSEPVFLDGDPMRLAQVLSNLLSNAFKYTPAGGQIDLIAERADSEVAIRVRDNGIGISAEMVPRIFDIYAQIQPASGSSLRGLGVGLVLVRQLTEMHGGSVVATSKGLGKGSEFVVRLPIAAEPKPEPAAAQTRKDTAPETAKRRVLIVDDNHDGADALALLLQVEGHQTHAVYDGPGALEIAPQFKPEVAILDIGLPGMNGYELARRLRELLPNLVLVALSGWAVGAAPGRARDADFDHHLTKPVELKELTRILAGQ